MGRTQSYDRDDVVRAARSVFWEQGYEGAPLPELERVTGLNRSSIYHAFGSKRGLFDAAVESYLDEIIRPRLSPLTVDEVAPGALEEYLLGLRTALKQPASLPASSGCLLVNTAAAPIGRDEAVAHVIAGYRSELRSAFGRGVAARRSDLDGAQVATLADACTGLVVSAFALARVDAAGAADAVGTAIALVTGSPQS
ncbi:TetR/AcrR family transcriptional regulator [Microbacterium sp. NE2HP2]|uniref:TetR/AcrR family transcriptional regulator n=1 Tax=Microbacterium TaxID=33882 RepID=UPI00236626D3|nr:MULTISPECIES: TetR/AcrR family transcriptional regulator [Microbacterium]MDD7944843.1 TetR/AcrR family transcriptional regulator [Microbacterium plantarum]WHE35248.1 TetR/AcrR family transcriptional regulator [Microbacterium sp. BDGP8]WRK16345.1 TetR/AcrR family transcriptional regulator [Microbacterium plantarum]